MTVLVLAPDVDPTADAVVAELAARDVPFFRTDLCDYPTRVWLRGSLIGGRWSATLSTERHGVEVGEIRSIWNRNPSTCVFPAAATVPEQDLTHREATLSLGDVLASLDVLWANRPNHCADAPKPYRWTVAAECGLDVADASVTARWSADDIAKGVTSVACTRRRPTSSDLAEPGDVAVTPQTVVPAHHEVRLVVIGERWFPIAIHARDTSAMIDWRSDPSAFTYELVPMPETVVAGISEYMGRTRMVYTAVDFVVTPDDRWVLVEADSRPHFAWLEAVTGAPMVAAMADLLMAGAV